MSEASPSRSKVATVLRVTSGNFLEMFDFFLFGFYATYISKTFFPVGNEFASLMLTFMTFGAGFLMRPLGAVFLGAYVDSIGRRKGLIVTLGIMATGTILIAFVPGYAAIGLFAPFLVLVGRLLQGFSAGVELGGVSVYLAEMATPGNKGFYVSWQSGSQQVAIMVAALIGFVLNGILTPADMNGWGWRIPFFIGCAIVPFLFYIRRSLEETEEFLARKHRPSMTEVFGSLARNWQIVLLGMLLVGMTTISFYTITVYTPTFGKNVLKLSDADSLLVTFCTALSNLFWLPVMGALSDRVGRKPILLVFSALTLLTAYPVLVWLTADASFGHMLIALLWLSFLYGSYNGAMVVALTEVVPASVRTAGFSLAYSLATALLGGFTPLVSTWLIEATGNRAAPGLWMAFGGACGLVATLLIYRRATHPAAAGGSPAPTLTAGQRRVS
ncbi:MFS transporter [Methylobacterium aerolatum]|uniref:MHS family citrate/tricarballylate:H+ symporter-like MFS transporter n=1 Tax=Methylobacterium aerolatum TaxID=418708 RepID=A0ABU0I3H9_9HYPH|nr:MFS transporter [Methylobacterium aerolatum]MDQ0449164.1 MHS family citrate/tricarballylate:H+ symporter-like MFS transporter [Methylobacterium aerolatum]GJD35351.1 Proline/betaine transporter [Methylobacterium aerolatum]